MICVTILLFFKLAGGKVGVNKSLEKDKKKIFKYFFFIFQHNLLVTDYILLNMPPIFLSLQKNKILEVLQNRHLIIVFENMILKARMKKNHARKQV